MGNPGALVPGVPAEALQGPQWPNAFGDCGELLLTGVPTDPKRG